MPRDLSKLRPKTTARVSRSLFLIFGCIHKLTLVFNFCSLPFHSSLPPPLPSFSSSSIDFSVLLGKPSTPAGSVDPCAANNKKSKSTHKAAVSFFFFLYLFIFLSFLSFFYIFFYFILICGRK
jgi:hypothetical protein